MDVMFVGFFHQYTDILTGYMGSLSFLKQVAELIKNIRMVNPDVNFGLALFLLLFSSLCNFVVFVCPRDIA